MLNSDRISTEDDGASEITITEAMIEAGEHALLCELGGDVVSSYWSASDLAKKVYAAMVSADSPNGRRNHKPRVVKR